MRRAIAVLIALCLIAPAAAIAQEDELVLTPVTEREDIVALLAGYAGDWTGRGESRADFDDPMEASACRLEATFDTDTATLTNGGACANAVRAIDIGGTLSVTEEGELTGGYFGQFEQAELLESNGAAYEEGFIINATYRLTLRGRENDFDMEVRVGVPILRDDGRTAFSLVMLVRDPDTDAFVEFTRMVFTRNLDA